MAPTITVLQLLLQSPLEFTNGKITKNRLVLAPMTNCQSQADGTLGSDEFQWLESTAKGGFGLAITCASHVMKTAQAWPGQLGIYDPKLLPGLKTLATMFKSHNTLGIVQLFHGGVRCPSKLTGVQPVSASEYDLPVPDFERPRALSVSEIKDIVQHFAQATQRAYEAGFDGVELHGANGYLITQFIGTQTNLRSDEYGGNLANRARFVREIFEACRKIVPHDFLIGIRLSPDIPQMGIHVDDALQIAEWLVQDGADFIDISQMNLLSTHHTTAIVTLFRERLGGDIPLIAGGKVHTPEEAKLALELGASLVYLGTIAIGNSDWPNRLFENDAFEPTSPPYTEEYLIRCGRSKTFIEYCKGLSRDLVAK